MAYVGREAPGILTLQDGDVVVINGSDNAVASGATDPRAVEQWLKAGVRVVNHPWLHAKVYVAGRTAIIGSANVSERARTGRIVEAAIKTTDSETVAEVREFIDDLIQNMGRDIDEDWVKAAKRLFPTRRIAPPWEPTPPPLTAPFRLWLGWWNEEPRDMTPVERNTYKAAVAGLPPTYRVRARYEPDGRLEGLDADGFFGRGDMVVMLQARNAQLVEFWKSRLAVRGRQKSIIGVYLRDTRLKRSVTNADVRRALEAVGSELPEVKGPHFGRWLDDSTERQAVLELWGIQDPGLL
ncbi:phospholipase D-like domain-containing protein [Micromonospora chalcea]|uniref:phospholipase D-like domain-containing protein n=1 Tax=Micromonospora chalcea TaxID=1874 RepID=UPI0021A6067F|nr:phospholipase D-like domain-containing protein [Micromonospora chalcea]MCT2282053.1 phospholipase D-like domain-containing protein [Micromonospora chalcea]